VSNSKFDIKKESSKSLIAKFVDAFSGFVGLIIFAQLIGAAGLGLYYICRAIATILARPASGIGVAIEKIGSEKNNKVKNYILIGLIIVSILSIIGFIFGFSLNYYYSLSETFQVTSYVIPLTIILFILLSYFTVLNRAYSGYGKTGNSIFLDAFRGILETVLQIIFLYLIGFSVESLLLGTIISTLSINIYLLYILPFEYTIPSKKKTKEILEYAKYSSVTKLFNTLYARVDTLLLAILMGREMVGIYEAVMRLVQVSKYVSYGLKRPLLVYVSKNQMSKSNINQIMQKLTPYASIFSIPILIGTLVIPFDILKYTYGSEFVYGYPVLIGGAIYYVIYTQTDIIESLHHGINNPQHVTQSVISATFVRTILLLITVPFLNFWGLIIAIILAELLRFSMLYYFKNNYGYKYKYRKRKLSLYLLSSILMGSVLFGISSTIEIQDIFELYAIIITCGVLYLLTILILDKDIKNHLSF